MADWRGFIKAPLPPLHTPEQGYIAACTVAERVWETTGDLAAVTDDLLALGLIVDGPNNSLIKWGWDFRSPRK